jgi:hypothetical protein
VAQHVICWKQSGWLQSNHPLLRGEVLDFEQVEERGISHLPISCWCKVQAWAIWSLNGRIYISRCDCDKRGL